VERMVGMHAECGAGVRTRQRTKTTDAKNSGKPCPLLTETETCNIQACNANCELGDWGEWSGCSKKCNKGHRSRRMPVKVAVKGTGTCPGMDSAERLGFAACNEKSCMSMLPSGRTTLHCRSKIDVVIMMDAGAALTEAGFNQSRAMVQKVLQGLGTGDVKVAVLQFGGPTSKESIAKCTQNDLSNLPDPEKDCGMVWVSHLTKSMANLTKKVGALTFPESTSMTSMALALAKGELGNGRSEADSVVLVVTNGKPMSEMSTTKAATDLKKAARLIWVPAGEVDEKDLENCKSWSSKPWQDNFVKIKDYNDMPAPAQVNTILASMCPLVD